VNANAVISILFQHNAVFIVSGVDERRRIHTAHSTVNSRDNSRT